MSKSDKSFLRGGIIPGLSSHTKGHSSKGHQTHHPVEAAIKPGKGFKGFKFPSPKHHK
jgi:hypothetical protein